MTPGVHADGPAAVSSCSALVVQRSPDSAAEVLSSRERRGAPDEHWARCRVLDLSPRKDTHSVELVGL
ncbi:unnamed protein product [Arctogadus glacialis]